MASWKILSGMRHDALADGRQSQWKGTRGNTRSRASKHHPDLLTALILIALLVLHPDTALSASEFYVSFLFSGPNAAQNLADAYTELLRDYRYLMIDERHRRVSSACTAQPTFFDLAICERIWPREAWQIQSFQEAILGDSRDTKWQRTRILLPAAVVTTSLSLDAIGDVHVKTSNDLDTSARESICKAHSWELLSAETRQRVTGSSEGKADAASGCVIEVDPPRTLPNLVQEPARIQVAQPSYKLAIQNPTHKHAAKEMTRDVLAYVVSRDKNAVGKVIPQVTGAERPTSLTRASSVSDICTIQHLENVRQGLKWPNPILSETNRPYLVIADPGITQPTDFGTGTYDSQYLHGGGGGSGLSFNCENTALSLDTEGARKYHAMAVATVIYGARTRFMLSGSPLLTYSGLLSPGPGQFVPASSFAELNQFQTTIEVGSFEDYFQLPETGFQAIYAAMRDIIRINRATMIFSAPEKTSDKQHNFPSAEDLLSAESYPSISVCDELPSCLGATPAAMVVAALDERGELLQPASYRLGSSVVWVSAPGANIVTALPSSAPGALSFAAVTGSSLAAPAAAAVAMVLMSKSHGSLSAQDTLARIAATADIYRTGEVDSSTQRPLSELVRFGRVNAARAITGAGDSLAVLWGSQSPTYVRVEAPTGITRATESLCGGDVVADRAKRGYLRLYRSDGRYTTGEVASRDEPQCVAVNLLLRLFPDNGQVGGKPTFTVVYLNTRKGTYSGVYEPRIERGMLLRSPEQVPEPCRIDGTEGLKQPSCLYGLKRGGTEFQALNLLADDIVFSPDNYQITRLMGARLWATTRKTVWGSGK